MRRRQLLSLFGASPFLGWLKPPPVITEEQPPRYRGYLVDYGYVTFDIPVITPRDLEFVDVTSYCRE